MLSWCTSVKEVAKIRATQDCVTKWFSWATYWKYWYNSNMSQWSLHYICYTIVNDVESNIIFIKSP